MKLSKMAPEKTFEFDLSMFAVSHLQAASWSGVRGKKMCLRIVDIFLRIFDILYLMFVWGYFLTYKQQADLGWEEGRCVWG